MLPLPAAALALHIDVPSLGGAFTRTRTDALGRAEWDKAEEEGAEVEQWDNDWDDDDLSDDFSRQLREELTKHA